MTKKKTSPNKRGPKPKAEKTKMKDRLKEIFLQGGMTAYQASVETGNDFKTVQKYFKDWAKELVAEEDREPWLEREKRVRLRALEGLSTKLTKVKKRLEKFEKILDDAMKNPRLIDDVRIELYEKIVRLNTALAADLTQQYDSIEMTPPTGEVILKEIERLVDERNKASEAKTGK